MPKKGHAESPPLDPAMHYLLMMGRLAAVNLGNWPRVSQALYYPEQYGPTPNACWLAHGRTLLTEARRAGFQPAWSIGKEASGSGPAAGRCASCASIGIRVRRPTAS